MNYAIIGYGSIGKKYLKILNKKLDRKKDSIFIFDKVFAKKKKRLNNYFYNISELNIFSINFVLSIISTPSNSHFQDAVKLVDKSRSILIEKPFVLSLKHADNLIKLSKLHKVKMYVCFQNRLNKSIQYLVQKKSILNKPFYIDCSLFWHRDFSYYKNNWRGNYSSDGGVLTNQAIHLLDTIIHLFGEIKNFNAIAGFNNNKLSSEDIIILNSKTKKNSIFTLRATTRSDFNYDTEINLFYEKQRILISGKNFNKIYIYKNGKKNLIKKYSETFYDQSGNGHEKLINLLIKNKKKSLEKFEISKNLHVMHVIHSIYNHIFGFKLDKISTKGSLLGK